MTNDELKTFKTLLEKRKEQLEAERVRLLKIREENEFKLRQEIFILKMVLPDDKYNEVIEIIRLRIKDECPEMLEMFNSYVI